MGLSLFLQPTVSGKWFCSPQLTAHHESVYINIVLIYCMQNKHQRNVIYLKPSLIESWNRHRQKKTEAYLRQESPIKDESYVLETTQKPSDCYTPFTQMSEICYRVALHMHFSPDDTPPLPFSPSFVTGSLICRTHSFAARWSTYFFLIMVLLLRCTLVLHCLSTYFIPGVD